MEDREFFDLLYQQWSKTTGAEDKFWMPEQSEVHDGYVIFAVDQEQHKHHVASNLSEADADFICGVHGCISDLIRRLHIAVDEADRADESKDNREAEIFELALECDELRERLARKDERVKEAEEREREANSYADHLSVRVVELERELDTRSNP